MRTCRNVIVCGPQNWSWDCGLKFDYSCSQLDSLLDCGDICAEVITLPYPEKLVSLLPLQKMASGVGVILHFRLPCMYITCTKNLVLEHKPHCAFATRVWKNNAHPASLTSSKLFLFYLIARP
jgi:hypothetical protein